MQHERQWIVSHVVKCVWQEQSITWTNGVSSSIISQTLFPRSFYLFPIWLEYFYSWKYISRCRWNMGLSGRMTHEWASKRGHLWLRYWLVVCSVPNIYLSQWCIIATWTIVNISQWSLSKNIAIFSPGSKTREISSANGGLDVQSILQSFGSCVHGVWMAGMIGLPFGLSRSIMSVAAGGLVKYTGTLVIITAAQVVTVTVLVNE